VENAVRTWRFGSELVEIMVIGPELKTSRGHEDFFNEGGDLAGGDESGIGDVISAERGATFPKIQADTHRFDTVRQGIDVVVQLRITEELADVIAGIIQM